MEEIKGNKYFPLIVIIATAIVGAYGIEASREEFFGRNFAHSFMGFFFLLFAMFKLFDINGFADAFQKYDLIAEKKREYAYAYPFIEMLLGVLYLAGHYLFLVNFLTMIVMIVSAVGVIKGYASGKDIKCACLGTVLNVPLSVVSVIENVGMGLMAAFMLVS